MDLNENFWRELLEDGGSRDEQFDGFTEEKLVESANQCIKIDVDVARLKWGLPISILVTISMKTTRPRRNQNADVCGTLFWMISYFSGLQLVQDKCVCLA